MLFSFLFIFSLSKSFPPFRYTTTETTYVLCISKTLWELDSIFYLRTIVNGWANFFSLSSHNFIAIEGLCYWFEIELFNGVKTRNGTVCVSVLNGCLQLNIRKLAHPLLYAPMFYGNLDTNWNIRLHCTKQQYLLCNLLLLLLLWWLVCYVDYVNIYFKIHKLLNRDTWHIWI